MDKRVNELRDRLWKKKAALQQKENLPVSGLLAVGGEGGSEASPGRAVSSRQRLRGQCLAAPSAERQCSELLRRDPSACACWRPDPRGSGFLAGACSKAGGELAERRSCLGVSSRLGRS